MNSCLRLIGKVQGVAAQTRPVDVVTFAPGGSELKVTSSFDPRVTVPQALTLSATATVRKSLMF